MTSATEIVEATAKRPAAVREKFKDAKCLGNFGPWDEAADEPLTGSSTTSRRPTFQAAERLCDGCPIRAWCLAESVLTGEQASVRGGLPVWRLRQLQASRKAGSLAPLVAEVQLIEAQDAALLAFLRAVAA